MLKTYKYRIYPTLEQQEYLEQCFNGVRLVYNLGLETKILAWTQYKKNLTCVDLSNQLIGLKKDNKWLDSCIAQSLQMSLRNLDNAYTNFFRGKGFPKFKSKRSKQSIQLPQGVKVDFENNKLFLPKLKQVDCIFDRIFKGNIKTTTVSRTTTNKYFVSILVDNEKDLPNKKKIKESTSIGIDLGITNFAILSNGQKIDNPHFLKRKEKQLSIEQRSLSRRIKGSNRREKQRLKVSLLHEKITNQRKDYLQKVSTSIIKNYDTIILEDLSVKDMMQNRILSKAIGEIGWSQFVSYLKYKGEWYGKNIIQIGRFEPSSKICSHCGTINKELKLSDRNWQCKSCGTSHDRDINAAINIKNFGLRNQPSIVNVEQ